MKILFVISDLSGGGAERILVTLANYFAKIENSVYILTLSNNKSFYEIDSRVKHIKLDLLKKSNSIYNKFINNFMRLKRIRDNIKDIKPDIIVSFLTQTNIITIIASIGLNIPIIISEHSIYFTENNNNLWRLLRRLTYPLADYLTILTDDDAKNYPFIKNKKVIPNFLKINEKYDFYKINEKEDIILAVGRLHQVKQFKLLIKLYSRLDTNYKLYIVGDGVERKELEKLIQKLNLKGRVFLKGQKKDIYKYYKKAKIFVLTSKYEAFPNVILEAMHFGCAIVSFDCDYGPRAIINNNINGFLVKKENEFLDKLNILIKNDELRIKMARNAIFRAKDFEYHKIIKEWESLINNARN